MRCSSHRSVEAEPGKRRCRICAALNKKYADSASSKGMCRVHVSRRAVIGHKRCEHCLMGSRLGELRRAGVPKSEVDKARRELMNFNGKCQCCGTRSSIVRWCLDHCHKTKKFRGIICFGCNVSLGFVLEDINKLKAMVKYIRRHHDFSCDR